MAITDMLNRRVRARPEDDDDVYSEGFDSGEEQSQDEAGEQNDGSEVEDLQTDDSQDDESEVEGSNSDSEADTNDDDSEQSLSEEESDANDDIQASLSNISFGALAKAQASLGPKKRKERATKSTPDTTQTASPLDDIRAQLRAKREAAAKASNSQDATDKEKKKAARSSKHAPMVQSSKYAVSRKRVIVEPSAQAKPRDPRFDAAVMGHSGKGHNPKAAEKNYAFLDEYRASELKDLKRQLAQTKNPEAKEALKRQIRSATDQQKARENRKREETVLAEHKKREKEAIREGKKSAPYYLKKSELKKQVMQKKYEEMGSRDRAKALERRRKKLASKERREMPMERRGFGEASGEPPAQGGGGKRRRLE